MQIERNVYLNKLIARKHNGFVKGHHWYSPLW